MVYFNIFWYWNHHGPDSTRTTPTHHSDVEVLSVWWNVFLAKGIISQAEPPQMLTDSWVCSKFYRCMIGYSHSSSASSAHHPWRPYQIWKVYGPGNSLFSRSIAQDVVNLKSFFGENRDPPVVHGEISWSFFDCTKKSWVISHCQW